MINNIYTWIKFKIKKRIREVDRRDFVSTQLTSPPGLIFDYAFLPQNQIISFPMSFPDYDLYPFGDSGSYMPFRFAPPSEYKERMKLVENYP